MLFLHTLVASLAIASPARAEEHEAEVDVDPMDRPWSLDASTPCAGPCTFRLPANRMHRVQIGDVHEDVWITGHTEIRYRPRIAPIFYTGAVLTAVGGGSAGFLAYALVRTGSIGSINTPTGTGLGIFFGSAIAAAVTGAILMIVTDNALHVKSTDDPIRPSAPSLYEGLAPGPIARPATDTVKFTFAF